MNILSETLPLKIEIDESQKALMLFGESEEHLKLIEKKLSINIDTRGSVVTLSGDDSNVELGALIINKLYGLLKKGFNLNAQDVDFAINILLVDSKADLESIFLDIIYVSLHNRNVTPKSINQKCYVDSIRKNDIVFGIGPAGTGKTYLAMACAVSALMDKKVERIVLTRPAFEAGEKLGFLPGDMTAKVDPYLRPLYDALHNLMDFEKVQKLLEQGVIEVAPLAFMRGRTLNDAFIILDEAQNTTLQQMQMFLTRLGFGSKVVVTGDITQIDLPSTTKSGLVQVSGILKDVKGIDFIKFTRADVVRHNLVQKIIDAFEKNKN